MNKRELNAKKKQSIEGLFDFNYCNFCWNYFVFLARKMYISVTFCTSQNEAEEMFKENEVLFVNAVSFIGSSCDFTILTASNYKNIIPEDYLNDFQNIFKNKVTSIRKANQNKIIFVFSSINSIEYGIVFVKNENNASDILNYYEKIKESWYVYTIAYT